MRHAIDVTHIETTLATRPTKGEVRRANAGFGELFGHEKQPSSLRPADGVVTPPLRSRFHRRRRLLPSFDLLRCFPSNTDRQSSLGDLPMSSYVEVTPN